MNFAWLLTPSMWSLLHIACRLLVSKFFRHFRKICTIKFFPMKKFWFLLALHYYKKRFYQQHLNHWFVATFRVSSLPEKKFYHHIFFWGKTELSPSPRLYAQVLKKVFRGSLSNRHIQWMNLTKRPGNHNQFQIFFNFFRFPEVTKL